MLSPDPWAGLPPLCTAEDVAALGVTGDPVQIDALIAASSAAVRTACGWAISYQAAADMETRGTGAKVVSLPTLWLLNVHSLIVDDTEWTGVEWLVGGIVLWPARLGAYIVANVDHGYDPVPPDVALTTAGMVARSIASPVGVVGERLGQWSVNYDASPFAPNTTRSATRVAPGDLATLAPYVLPKVP